MDRALEADRVRESYRALDALATAIFQVGAAFAVGGITVGIVEHFRHHYLLAVWGLLPLSAGFLAGLTMVDVDNKPPTLERLEKKRRSVHTATALLILYVGGAACYLIFSLITSGSE